MTERARGLLFDFLNQSWNRYELLRLQCKKKARRGAVHDFRTEIRRLLAALDLLESLESGNASIACLAKSIKRELHRVRSLRDIQVQEKAIEKESALRALSERLKRRKKESKAAVRDCLSSRRFLKNQARWAKIQKLRERARPRDRAVLLRKLRAEYRELCSARVAPEDLATVHRLRIRFRRYRYLCGAILPLHPLRKNGARADRFQKALGDLQDEVILSEMLGKKERAFKPRVKKEIGRLVDEVLKERDAAVRSLRPRHRA